MNKIVVVGSINADLVFITDKSPSRGSTVIGKSFSTIPGGKGANQAVAAARLGGHVAMIGLVGQDIYGQKMIENLKDNNINTSAVGMTDVATGTAGIIVDASDNRIVVIPGANSKLDIEYIKAHRDILASADMVIVQLEVPLETVAYVLEFCNRIGVDTILNPAPSQVLNPSLIEQATYITPNEHEAKEILGDMALSDMLKAYPNKLIVTLGDRGAVFYDGKEVQKVPVQPVEIVDTTGAGDTFNGALAFALVEKNADLEAAVRFAVKTATISVTKHGAQGGMPTKEALERWL